MEPETGQVVHVRSRRYLVEGVEYSERSDDSPLVRLACLEDDAQGELLEVLWRHEVDAKILGASSWAQVTQRGFDQPRLFSAYLHTLRWNCVTSTDPQLFQAPYRAGIEVKAYQLEPLRKALLLPRVNLFIADDVGLGKTIEAGLILRELLMRQKVRQVVVCCPPSVVRQWRDEMEQRFGLTFVIFDRDYVAQKRRERGYGVNVWKTHSRFIISQALIRDEGYAGPLRDWLDTLPGGSLLILDEAHNAAPASGSKYAVDSKLTKVVRELAKRFEHRLFLSATPHNGHSNSFAALLEILDPQRFCRGVQVNPKLLDAVMVRRLKMDLREVGDDFPLRKVLKIVLDGLPEDAPELQLSRLLAEYRAAREERLSQATRKQKAAGQLVTISLQKRLLSSVEAFARTLREHAKSVARHVEKAQALEVDEMQLLAEAPGADDERAELSEAEVQAEEDQQLAAASAQSGGPAQLLAQELELVKQMQAVAEEARHSPGVRLRHLIGWIRAELCPDLGKPGAPWRERRVLLFTEYTDTKRYLQQQLGRVIAGSDRCEARIATFHGGIGEERREAIKAAFNSDPAHHPLRILIATDAAREGVNLQNHCADLFHFDIPWNPSRMEQRNGRIDRKLQRAPEVRCHYYVLPQRAEDRVLEVLVSKTDTVRRELGSLSAVVERRVSTLLGEGIRHEAEGKLRNSLEAVDRDQGAQVQVHVIEEELEGIRKRREDLGREIGVLRELLQNARNFIRLDDEPFRDALSASLELLGAEGLQPLEAQAAVHDASTARWVLPRLHERAGADPTWAVTLDSLRAPRQKGQKPWDWRREAPIRPVVFRDPGSLDGEVVHLHLEHRVVQRLLGRFLAQGFLHHELSRACVVRTEEATPKVVALGRLSLYGERAARLHDSLVAVAAEWVEPERRGRKKLRPLSQAEKQDVLDLLERSLASPRLREVPDGPRRLLSAAAPQDASELVPHLEKRAEVLSGQAVRALVRRGRKEAQDMRAILEAQQRRIEKERDKVEADRQLLLKFAQEERKQLEDDLGHWRKRLKELEEEVVQEPLRIEAGYVVKARRIEPVGLAYLWPVSS